MNASTGARGAAMRLASVVITALLAFTLPCANVQAETLRLGGTGSAIGTMKALAEAYQAVDPGFELVVVPNLGSSGGIKALQSGATQLAAISRDLKPAEAALGLRGLVYGVTPFALVTTEQGQVNLSLQAIADLYAGRQTHWSPGRPVRLVLRPASDGDTELLASFSPGVRAAKDAAMAREGMVVALTDQEAVDAVERLPGGLGTASLAVLVSEKRRARPLAIEGVQPTVANLANGTYPFAKTMVLVCKDDAPPSVRRFLEFVRSDAGARVLIDNGHRVPRPDDNAQGPRP
jgi:phosphate transport system substrate-binding protein